MFQLLQEAQHFGTVGILAAAGHYATLIALVEVLRSGPVPAALAGYLVGGTIGYILNRRWGIVRQT
jgi:putative flippase GtrA